MELNIDTLQLSQNRDLVDYLNIIFQGLIAIGTLIAAIGIGSWVRNIMPKKENVEGEFTFETKSNQYRVILGLRNIGKNRIDFDPKQGVYIQWESGKYHKINLPEDRKDSSIHPQGSAQLRYLIDLDDYEKSKIDSKKIKVYIYTTRNNKFQLRPTIRTQLGKYWEITKEEYDENVKNIKD